MIGHCPDTLIFWIIFLDEGLDLTYDMSVIISAIRISRVVVEISEHSEEGEEICSLYDIFLGLFFCDTSCTI